MYIHACTCTCTLQYTYVHKYVNIHAYTCILGSVDSIHYHDSIADYSIVIVTCDNCTLQKHMALIDTDGHNF